MYSHRQFNWSVEIATFLQVSNSKILNQYVSLSQMTDNMKPKHLWDLYFNLRSQVLISQWSGWYKFLHKSFKHSLILRWVFFALKELVFLIVFSAWLPLQSQREASLWG